MSVKTRFVFLAVVSLLALVLAGCAGAFIGLSEQAVDSNQVNTTMQYVDGAEEGPLYNVSMTVPDEWVGQFQVRNIGNVVYFDYTGNNGSAQIFSIEALSEAQYWKQSGSYPGSYVNIVNRGDTYFIYNLPIDPFYAGLPEAEFTALSDVVPQVVASFDAEAAR